LHPKQPYGKAPPARIITRPIPDNDKTKGTLIKVSRQNQTLQTRAHARARCEQQHTIYSNNNNTTMSCRAKSTHLVGST
jgi:hypothetical protein